MIVRGFLLNPWIKGATCALSTESFFCIHPSFKKTFPGAGLVYVRGSGQGAFGLGFVCVYVFMYNHMISQCSVYQTQQRSNKRAF